MNAADRRGIAWGLAIVVVLFHIALLLGPGFFAASYGG